MAFDDVVEMLSEDRDVRPPSNSSARPTASVIVPCFNGGRFLDALMASLDRQTFRDFEIVIVDDGSDDAETVEKLAALEGRARVIHQENRGPSAARNTAIAAARADIVAMLDCDDTIEPDFLAATVPLLQSAPPDVAAAVTHQWITGAEEATGRRYFNRFDLLFTNTLSPHIALRKSAWCAVGGFDETMREGYEDWDFSLRLADAGYRAIEVRERLYLYHVRSTATWVSLSAEVDKNLLHAKLWRTIREKHAASYRFSAILRAWWQSRDGSGEIPLWKGLVSYALMLLLPDSWYNWLVAVRRERFHAARRVAHSALPEAGG